MLFFPRTQAGVEVGELCFILLAVQAPVSPLETLLIKYSSCLHLGWDSKNRFNEVEGHHLLPLHGLRSTRYSTGMQGSRLLRLPTLAGVQVQWLPGVVDSCPQRG